MDNDSNSELPRIHLENFDDWSRVKDNFISALSIILEQALASSDASHVRDPVSAHLAQWSERLFSAAGDNLRVNGHNLDHYQAEQEATEPYDEVLDRRIWSLSEEHIAWDKTLADRRRKVPLQIENLVLDLLQRQREAETIHHDDNPSHVPEIHQPFDRLENVISLHGSTMNLANELRQSVPNLLEKSKRAKIVAQEVEHLQHSSTL